MPRPPVLPQRRRRQQPQQQQSSRSSTSSSLLDPYHNRDQPCCQELAEICRQVLEAGQTSVEQGSSSSYPTLFDFVRHYLVEASCSLVPPGPAAAGSNTSTALNNSGLGASVLSSSTSSTAAAAKKKRKKKKKKGKVDDDNDNNNDNDVNEDDTDAPPTAAVEGSFTPPPSKEEDEPHCGGSSGHEDAGANVECSGTAAVEPRQHATPPPPPRSSRSARRGQPTLFDMMAHEYFATTTTATTTATTTTTSPTAAQVQDFWKFVDQAAATTTSVVPAGISKPPKPRNNGGVPGPAVSVSALQQMKDRIACDKCRNMVNNLLETEHKCVLYRPPSSLKPSEHAYSLMEEGALDESFVWRLQQQRELAFHLAVSDEDEMVWHLGGMGFGDPPSDPHRGNNDNDNNDDDDPIEDESGQRHQALDWRRVILYNYVLARGVAGTDLVGGATVSSDHPEAAVQRVPVQPLDPTIVRGIADTVQSTLLGHQSIFRDCANALERLLEKINNRPPRGSHNVELTESNIDLVAFSGLRDIDEECCTIMSQLLGLLLDLTSSFFVAYAAASEDAPSWRKHDMHHLQELVLHLWDCWLDNLQRVVHDIASYEGYTCSLIDRHGQYPAPFYSSTYRDFYRELVRHKLTCVYQLLDKLRKLADSETETPGMNPEDHKASVHRKLLTYSIFCRHTMGMDYKRAHSWTPLDVEVQGVLKAALECFTTPIRATGQQVQLEHENRGQRLLRRCGLVFATSNQQVKSLQGSILQLLGSSSSQESQSDPILRNGDDESNAARTLYRGNLKEALMPLLRAWFMEQRLHWINRSSTCIPLMPASLLRTMVFENEDHDCFQRGHTRTACFFVVLLFRWLSDVHEAWRANMAEQDLLKSMSSLEAEAPLVDGALDATAGTSNKGKQGKKKKKKKDGVRNAESPKALLVDEMPAQPSLPALNGTTKPKLDHPRISKTTANPEGGITNKEMPNLKQSGESNGIAANSAAPAANASSFDHSSIEKTLNGDLKVFPNHALMEANEIGNGESKRTASIAVDKSGHFERKKKRSDLPSLAELVGIDTCAKIGLDDASGYQTAEEFLVGRLMAVLQDPGP